MAITLSVPDNVPVSWLQPLTQLCAGTLMLASEPGAETETQYMSKYFTYGFLAGDLCSVFDIGGINDQISALWKCKVSISDCFDNTLCCENGEIGTPYIISSITQDWRGIVSVDGYRLSSGMHSVFSDAGENISVIIPSLRSKTTELQDPMKYYISAITDANGHIQSFGRASLSASLVDALGTSTVSCPSDSYLTSVTTTGGRAVSAGYELLHQVWYKDFSRNSDKDAAKNNPEFTENDLINLHIMKLTKQQFDILSIEQKIEASCIYMTISDDYDKGAF